MKLKTPIFYDSNLDVGWVNDLEDLASKFKTVKESESSTYSVFDFLRLSKRYDSMDNQIKFGTRRECKGQTIGSYLEELGVLSDFLTITNNQKQENEIQTRTNSKRKPKQ